MQLMLQMQRQNNAFQHFKNKWDKEILKILNIPKYSLPIVKDLSDDFGFTDKSITETSYPINGVVDQQAAAIGQSCFFTKGSVKSTYGTGAFVLMNTGNKKIYSKNKLLTTICYRLNGKNNLCSRFNIYCWCRSTMVKR